jgi:hypothetical protein
VANDVAIAGLCCGFAGALVLARALAFESPEEYAESWARGRTVGALGGLNAKGDFAHVRDAVEARVGALLVGAGFVGQAVAATRSHWSSTAATLAYIAAALAIGGVLLALRPWRRHRERETFLAQLDRCRGTWSRYRVYAEYLAAFTQRGQTKEDLDKWVAVAERRTGRHPWHMDLPRADRQAVEGERDG